MVRHRLARLVCRLLVREAPLAAGIAAAAVLLPAGGAGRAEAFDGARAKATIDTLASDAFLGRKSGLASGRMSEEFAARRFAASGLEPGEAGGYFHEFPMLATEEKGGALELLDGPYAPLAFLYGDDFVLATNSGSGEVVAEAVLVGRGIADSNRNRDDYGELDLRGKIAVVWQGDPNDLYDWERAASRDSTLEDAVRRGAAGVLWLRGERATAGGAVHEGSYRPDLPLASIGPRVLEHLLAGTGYDIERYRSELAEGPLPFPTGKRLRLAAKVDRVEPGRARNVVGLVRGSDPDLRGEIVVIGAHLDHIGVNGAGRVYNGANDNASGASVVLELARSFAAAGRAPKRTLAFVLFAAEEQGLLGSLAFVQDPPLDLDSAIAMMNLDVEGHGNGKVGIGGGDFFPDAWTDFRASLGEALAESLVEGRPWGSESSDHAPFRNAGIPAMSIWSEGEHRFYHRIDDDPEWVTEEVLGSVGRMTERWVRALADREGPLLAPHRRGRSMLYDADQIDFDADTDRPDRPYVRGSVRWVDAVAEGEDLLRAAGDLRVRADAGDSLSVVAALGEIRGASRGGRKAVLLGIRAGAASLAPETEALLREVGVGLAELGPAPAEIAPGDSGRLESFVREGIVFLAPPDLAADAALPEGAKCLVRFRLDRGEEIAEPDSFPRGAFLFVATLGGPADPEGVARALERLGPDRVHLDLVPWALAGGGPSAGSGEDSGASGGGGLAERESEIAAFLEELRRAGRFEPHEMRALLGGNLARF